MRRSDGRTAGRPDGLWRLIVEAQGRSGVENMAADVALLDEAVRLGTASLRLYCWNPPTLSIGRNQQGDFHGVPTVRRPTGGQAVWHEHEATYAVAAPIALFGSLRKAYCEIHSRLATALRSLGVDAVIASDRPAVGPSGRPAACFAAAVGGEILHRGGKLVGSAQVRRGEAFLQHGSILLAGAQTSSFNGGTTLAAVLGRGVTFGEVVDAIIRTWSDLRPSGRQAVRPSVIASPAPQ
jgi:lipoate-protein ligase A